LLSGVPVGTSNPSSLQLVKIDAERKKVAMHKKVP
jgi:hypothetical protein